MAAGSSRESRNETASKALTEGERGASAVVSGPIAVTFISPAASADLRGAPFFLGRKPARVKDRLRIADEDGARLALGPDTTLPTSGVSAISLEHLARIALG